MRREGLQCRAAMAVAAVRSFEELREECLQKGELWEDPDFPATQASVFYHQTPPFTFEWKRPNVSDECRELDARFTSRSTNLHASFCVRRNSPRSRCSSRPTARSCRENWVSRIPIGIDEIRSKLRRQSSITIK